MKGFCKNSPQKVHPELRRKLGKTNSWGMLFLASTKVLSEEGFSDVSGQLGVPKSTPLSTWPKELLVWHFRPSAPRHSCRWRAESQRTRPTSVPCLPLVHRKENVGISDMGKRIPCANPLSLPTAFQSF